MIERSIDCRSRDGRRYDFSIFYVRVELGSGEHAACSRQMEVDTPFAWRTVNFRQGSWRSPLLSSTSASNLSSAEFINNIDVSVNSGALCRPYDFMGDSFKIAWKVPAYHDDFRRRARHAGSAHERRASTTSKETEDS